MADSYQVTKGYLALVGQKDHGKACLISSLLTSLIHRKGRGEIFSR